MGKVPCKIVVDDDLRSLALQRRLVGDRGRWRTVGRIVGKVSDAMHRATILAEVCESMTLRIVEDDQKQLPVYLWSSAGGWVCAEQEKESRP